MLDHTVQHETSEDLKTYVISYEDLRGKPQKRTASLETKLRLDKGKHGIVIKMSQKLSVFNERF